MPIRGEVGFEVTVQYTPAELDQLQWTMLNELAGRMTSGQSRFAVELLKRARAVVPYGPKTAAVAYSIRTRRAVRPRGRDGLSHPGALQRSGKLTVGLRTRTSSEYVLSFSTPYAALQHSGWSNPNLSHMTRLHYTRPKAQANYLYDFGMRNDQKSPLEVMIAQGKLSEIVDDDLGGIAA